VKKGAKIALGALGIVIMSLVTVIVVVLVLKGQTFEVRFVTNGGSEVLTQEIKRGENAAKPINPTKEGYTFDGWYLDGEKYYFDEPVSKDMVLEARWVKKETGVKVTVTFDTQGAGTIEKIETSKGEKIEKPADPVKDGYRFIGWTLNNNSFDFDNPIMNDIKLVAQWEKIVIVTVKFDTKGGSDVSSVTLEKGEKVTRPKDPTRSGYTFTGWTLNGKAYDFNSKVTGDITLVATWKETVKENYTVSFNTDGGNDITSQTVLEGEKATKPTDPVKEGYKFNGWTLNGKTYDFNSKVTKNITLVATWEQLKYTVTFKSNGQTLSTQTIVHGATATKPADPTREGYKFLGWMRNGVAFSFDTKVTGNVILEAAWELIPVPDVYTVKHEFFPNDVTKAEAKIYVYKNGVLIVPSQLLNQKGEVLGNYQNSIGAVRVNSAQYFGATAIKVKLSDNTIVDATRV